MNRQNLVAVVEGVIVLVASALAATCGRWPLVATLVIGIVVWLWLNGHIPLGTKRKGRKGLLNLRVDVPKAMVAQDKRLRSIGDLSGRIFEQMQISNATIDPSTHRNQMVAANKFAAAIQPLAKKMTAEAEGLRSETAELSSGLARWLEIAERENAPDGLVDQVDPLIKMLKTAPTVLPALNKTRQVFEKLRGASDTMDVSCGEVVDAYDVVTAATQETITTAESALRRIKKLLEASQKRLEGQ
jgi:hypothetical protein